MSPRILQGASNKPPEAPQEVSKRVHEGFKSHSSDHPPLLTSQIDTSKTFENHNIHTVLSKNKMAFHASHFDSEYLPCQTLLSPKRMAPDV